MIHIISYTILPIIIIHQFELFWGLFISPGLPAQKPASIICNDEQSGLFYSTVPCSKWTEAWGSHKLQVPGLSYNWWGFQTWDTFQDNTDNSSINKAETSLEWLEHSPSSKIRLMRSLFTWIVLYACESWTLTAELQRWIQAMEMRCYRKILRIFYKDHVTNEKVRAKMQ